MRSGLLKEATLVGGSVFVIGAALMQFQMKGVTNKKYWPYLGVFITGFSAHLLFEAFGLNKKYCDVVFDADPDDWGEEIDWEDKDEDDKEEWEDIEWSAETFAAEDEAQAYLMLNWDKQVPYELHNAGCKHGNFASIRDKDIDVFPPKSIKGVCQDYIQAWEENLGGSGDYINNGDLDVITNMTFSQFMRSDYTKHTLPIKLSPCHRDNLRIKEFCDTTLVGDISPLTYLRHDAESFEAEGKPTSVEVKRSTNDEKKLMAVFSYPDGGTKTTHFGQRGASDYTKHGEKERMQRYLERHGGGTTTSTKEDWKDPTTAGALSRWILWNKPSLNASFNDFKKRFNLKGELKVSKSAETFESETVAFESFRGRWNVGQTREIEGVRVKKMRNGAFKLDFQGESIIIYDGQFHQINRNDSGGFSMGRYDSALNGELLRSGYSEKDVPDNMEAIIRWKHRVGGGRLVIRSPFKKARHIFAGGLYHFTLPGQAYGGVFYPTNQGKTYRFIRRNGEPIVGRFPKKNEAWLDIRYDAESFESDTYITRKNRKTGHYISLVAPGIEAHEDEGWMLICEKHSNVCSFPTRTEAEQFFALPNEWCEMCMG